MQPIWRILITPILRNISKSPWFSLYIYISISLFVYCISLFAWSMQPIWRILITPILRNLSKYPWFSLYIYISISLFVYLTICLVAAANLKDSYISLSFSLNVSVSLYLYLCICQLAWSPQPICRIRIKPILMYLSISRSFLSLYLFISLYFYIYLYIYICISICVYLSTCLKNSYHSYSLVSISPSFLFHSLYITVSVSLFCVSSNLPDCRIHSAGLPILRYLSITHSLFLYISISVSLFVYSICPFPCLSQPVGRILIIPTLS